VTGIDEFLAAALNDKEAWARAAAEEFGPDWIEIWTGVIDLTGMRAERARDDVDEHVTTNDARVSRFIVRNDPTHVLADVARTRLILSEHESSGGDDPVCGRCVFHRTVAQCRPVPYPCLTVRLIAAEFDGYPGFKPEWRIGG
jgi:hypothetical protein